jgi:hypothetical protein
MRDVNVSAVSVLDPVRPVANCVVEKEIVLPARHDASKSVVSA